MDKHLCPSCGTEFLKKVYKKTQAVYCSQKCAYIGRSIGSTKRIVEKPYNCRRKPERSCVICEKTFLYKKKDQQHCSQKCYNVTKSLRMLGEKNWAYKDGESYLRRGYRGGDWETIRMEIYKRDNFTCKKCGVKCESRRDFVNSNNIIQCHHIENYNGVNNNNENLITLCLACHLKEHNGNQ